MKFGKIRNQRGQGLAEYLIIVCLVAVGSIVVMRVLGNSINAKFTSVAQALQGQERRHNIQIDEERLLRKNTMQNFTDGAGNDQQQ